MFAQVILPVQLQQLFTYQIPTSLVNEVRVGMRVVVQFGVKRYVTGIVRSVSEHSDIQEGVRLKEVLSVLDDAPMVTENQFLFWEWIADYYQCSVGEVYRAAIPSGLKLESETRVYLNEAFVLGEIDHADIVFTDNEKLILEHLFDKEGATVNELAEKVGKKTVLPQIKSLIDKAVLILSEELREGFVAKKRSYYVLPQHLCSEEALNEALKTLSRAKKQHQLLLNFLHLANYANGVCSNDVAREQLLELPGATTVLLQELVKRNFLQVVNKEESRLQKREATEIGVKELNEAQQTALVEIKDQFKTFDTVLLHGVTSSGKTELYMHLIEECIGQGKQALYLLPEIALTTQITNRLTRVFGEKVAIYHSKFTDSERVEVYKNLLSPQRAPIVLGVRSSIFLPFSNLGLIIVDEEHESSYKQFDPAPRYHARDAAYMLARRFGAKLVLGSATPSVESYYNVQCGKIGLVNLFTRYADMEMPEIRVVDIKEMKRKKRMNSAFSQPLIEGIQLALQNQEQVILFQNRRGFAPFVECLQCGYVPKCQNCDVSMTYHRAGNRLVCHYCGISYAMSPTCKSCKSTEINTIGFGTQKIEEEIKLIFPNAVVARMDTDTATTRRKFEQIITEFENKKIDILIGTQMISKGLDFNDVRLVGILNADSMLNIPDFRAHERAFQLMAQVAGRSGRKGKRGEVFLQTYDVEHPVIKDVLNHNFLHHFQLQLAERQLFKYPPFVRMVQVTLKHKDEGVVHGASVAFAGLLRGVLQNRVLGPQIPHIARIQTYFIRKLVVKFELSDSLVKGKAVIQEAISHLQKDAKYKSLLFVVDVDPM